MMLSDQVSALSLGALGLALLLSGCGKPAAPAVTKAAEKPVAVKPAAAKPAPATPAAAKPAEVAAKAPVTAKPPAAKPAGAHGVLPAEVPAKGAKPVTDSVYLAQQVQVDLDGQLLSGLLLSFACHAFLLRGRRGRSCYNQLSGDVEA